MKQEKQHFPVLVIDRDTINIAGFKGDGLSDDTMEKIADYVSESMGDFVYYYIFAACVHAGIEEEDE